MKSSVCGKEKRSEGAGDAHSDKEEMELRMGV